MSAPATKPRWATGGGALITTPSSGAQDTGHVPSTALTAQLANWFWNLVYQWIVWFDAQDIANTAAHAAYDLKFAARDFIQARNTLTNTGVLVDTGTAKQVTGICAVTPADRNDERITAVACCEGGKTAYTTIGDADAAWTVALCGSSYTGDLNGILYVASLDLLLVYGTSGEIQSSPNGTSLTWTRRKNGGSSITGMATDGTTIAAVDAGGHVWTSTNGTSWTDAGALVGASARDIDYGNSTWVVSESGQIRSASSPAGSWTVHVNSDAGQIYNTRWCADLALWVQAASGTNFSIYTSANLTTWVGRAQTSATYGATAVVPVPGGVVVAGWDWQSAGSGYFTSNDGITWNPGNAARIKNFDDGGGAPNRPFALLYYPTVREYKFAAGYSAVAGDVRIFNSWSKIA